MAGIHKIAVFISHIYGDYQRNVCQGIIDKASQYNYHVDIFTSNDEKVLGEYSSGEAAIISIPNPTAYDGAIIASSTYLLSDLKDEIVRNLKGWKCPVVEINSVGSPFPNVFLDNNSPIADVVAHLIRVHSLNNISYLGNSLETSISKAREGYYRNAMKDFRLEDKISVASSDYSLIGIQNALDQLLENNPQAIICYNDAMAYTVLGELAVREISVPDQIAVTGCDNLEFGQRLNCPLTSITFPAYEVGFQAFQTLIDLMDGCESQDAPIVKAKVHLGGTCGCHDYFKRPSILLNNSLKAKIDSLEGIFLKDILMTANLQGVTDIDVATEVLADSLERIDAEQKIEGLKEFYLCLNSDWEQISDRVRELTLTEDEFEDDRVILKLAYKNHTLLPNCTFSRRDSLPEFIRKNGSEVYVFTPLYFGTRSFGYICMAYANNMISYPFSFVSWIQIVDNMLQTISANRNIQLMMNRLEDLYQKDGLTGIWNYQAFRTELPSFLERAHLQGSLPVAIVLDIDRLKHINDVYGHAEGNFAIQVLGQAITRVCTDTTLPCRFGGDEFYLLDYNLSKEEAQDMITRIQDYLNHYNNTEAKPYAISVSGGFAVSKDFSIEAIDYSFKIADKNMYLQKQSHRRSTV